jgi:hypothetical protein
MPVINKTQSVFSTLTASHTTLNFPVHVKVKFLPNPNQPTTKEFIN